MGANVHGSFYWNELRVRNIEETKAFYHKLLGWHYDEMKMEEGDDPYFLCKSGEQVVAGMFEMNEKNGFTPDVPPHWLGLIQVENVDACLEIAKSENSEIYFGPFDVPDVGRIVVLQDKGGAPIGLITPF
ncbi:MAG: VOC family protein [Terasakiella sp.]|uniref:VOC family protein n=1 Tax=unclassified Terasakiella TaxID=2614952 RepID=UPI003B00BE1A